MSDGGIQSRVAVLEAKVAQLEKTIDSLIAKLDKLTTNEVAHLEARIGALENSGGLTREDWVKIIIAIAGIAGGIITTWITVFGGV